MITLEEKINQFKELVNSKVDNENLHLIDEKKQELELYLSEEKALITESQKKNVRLALERINRQKKETISTVAQEQRREVLKMSDQFMSILLSKVEEKCKIFTQGEEYPNYIGKVFENTIEKEDLDKEDKLIITLALSNYTAAHKTIQDKLRELGFSNVEFVEGDASLIGGFIIQSNTKNLRINKTLCNAIENRKEDIGKFMQEYIREGGAI